MASSLLSFPVLFSSYTVVLPTMVSAVAGFGLFLMVFALTGPPVKSYILEHELSHLIFALASGIRVKEVSLGKSRAYVKTDRVNIFVALFPYAFPLYSLFIIGIYRIAGLFFQNSIFRLSIFFLFGLSVCFHIVSTIHYIQLDQPDLRRYGYFPSLVLIFFWEIVVLAVMLSFMLEKIQLIQFFLTFIKGGMEIYSNMYSIFMNVL